MHIINIFFALIYIYMHTFTFDQKHYRASVGNVITRVCSTNYFINASPFWQQVYN